MNLNLVEKLLELLQTATVNTKIPNNMGLKAFRDVYWPTLAADEL